jgi:alginate O-acetyltransferase complex protein AlgI
LTATANGSDILKWHLAEREAQARIGRRIAGRHMLFNTPEFIFLFLPCALALHFVLARWSLDAALLGTALSSLFFYAWWDPRFIVLPLVSIALNLWIAREMIARPTMARELLIAGIVGNLLALGYFKYTGFLVAILARSQPPVPSVPLALSFTTFVQIAFLANVYMERKAPDLRSYSAFVLFFPHLIAGPVVRWSSFGTQLRDPSRYRWNWDNVALGLTVFVFGLAKKVLIADPLSPHVTHVFDAADQGAPIMAAAAWFAVFAFAMQVYFDFSGYSDMAIGLGLLFNYRLPLNFAAPFRSPSEFDLWQRWHVSLSRLLREFVYVPLCSKKPGPVRRGMALTVTMLISGLWHGANWTFLAWGAVHGVALVVNMIWRNLRGVPRAVFGAKFFGWAITFLVFAVSLAFFRAPNIESSWRLFAAMAGFGHAPVPEHLTLNLDTWAIRLGFVSEELVRSWFGATWSVAGSLWTLAALAIALLVPDTMEIVDYREDDDLRSNWRRQTWKWRPTLGWFALIAIIFVVAVNAMKNANEFFYYQF